jgi:hypothetical protein
MALITGSPSGTITLQEDLFVEGAPNIWFQDQRANPLYNPNPQGFYWGLSATLTYPVNELGCVQGVQLTENLTMNDVICDSAGVKDTVQRRNYLEFNLTVKTLFPLGILRHIINGGAVTVASGVAMMGIGAINNAQRYRVYWAKVYDESVGAYLNGTLHKAKFVDAWTIDMRYGQEWQITGIKVRAYAQTLYPSDQLFSTILRADAAFPA